jgi:DNA-binding response OmpR family regulator
LIREAIEAMRVDAAIHFAHDGQQAVEFIDKVDQANAPCPDLVLLDLNLPKKDGVEVLRHIRGSLACRGMLVLIVSSSDSATDREAVRKLGFSRYFRKPSVYAEFMKLGPIVRELLEAH